MVRNLSIRSRILAVLALPVLVLVAAAAVFSWSSYASARDATQLQRAVQAGRGLPALVAALDAERTASTEVLDGDDAAAGDLTSARTRTDSLLGEATGSLAEVDTSRLAPEAAQAVAAAQRSVRQVRDVRSVVDQGRQSATLVSATYETAIGSLSDLPAALSADASGTTADALRASTSLQQLVGLLADERDVGTRALQSGGGPDSAERTSLVGIAAQIASTRSESVRLARSAGVQVPPPGVALAQLRAAVEGDPGAGFALPSVESWRAALNAEITALAPSAESLAAAGSDGVAREAATARTTALAVAGGALAAVVVPLVIALLIARGITEPLRALTRAAGDVRARLPRLVEAAHGEAGRGQDADADLQPIPVRSHDEVGRLAAAFNEVNATSVRVAREQAALRAAIASSFVTVARRDQALLNRQLSFIDTLERAEEDPAVLEDLFTLDHLATRMRRNAESLLVLAGIDGGRRLRAPMPLSDVVRTASSEIEDYRRVDLALGADPAVLGHLALPAAHLLAELLENATRSSDPVTRVRVATAALPSGVLLTVTDDGIGMSPQQREEVAARLADPSATAAVGASELGFFVVGRIARRLGAQVEVHAGAVRGTVVAVSLPAAVFAGSVEAVAPEAAAPQPALPVRATATGAMPVVRLPETRLVSPAPVAPAARPAERPAAARAAVPAPTGGGLPRRVPRAARPGPALPAAAPAATAAAAAAPVPPRVPADVPSEDPSVARRSAVFRTFAARRGPLEPTAVADPAVDIDLTAIRTPLAAGSPVPSPVAPVRTPAAPALEDDAASAPAATELGSRDPLPARDDDRSRGVHAGPKRGLFARRPAGSTGQQPAVPAAAVAASGVRPMTRRELRALEASGQLSAVRGLPTGAVRPPAAAPTPQPAAAASPAAPPLVPLPAVVGPVPSAAAVRAAVTTGALETPFRPVPAAASSPSALPHRAHTAAPAAAGGGAPTGDAAPDDTPTGDPAAAGDRSGWLAQRAAPLRPLPKMPPAAGGGRPLALGAAFDTGPVPREAYAPASVATGSAPLARRAPAVLAPGAGRAGASQHPPRRREPAEVRSMLAGYTSGVSRARRTTTHGPTHGTTHGQTHAPDSQEER